MTKYKPKKDKTEPERLIYNYDYRQIKSKQDQFERRNVISCSKLGYNDIDDLAESIIERLSPQTTRNHNHRPNLFDDNHPISPVIRIK